MRSGRGRRNRLFPKPMEVIPRQSRGVKRVAWSGKGEALMAWCVWHLGLLESDMGSAVIKKVRNEVFKGLECPSEEEKHGLILRFRASPSSASPQPHTTPQKPQESLPSIRVISLQLLKYYSIKYETCNSFTSLYNNHMWWQDMNYNRNNCEA